MYLAVVITVAVWLARRPSARQRAGLWLGFAWNLPAVLLLQVVAASFHWWTFEANGGLILGMPVDLCLVWAWLWALPALAFPSLPLGAVMAVAVVADVFLMPLASPTVRLGQTWLVGEAAAVAVALLPAQLLARWTANDKRLHERAVLQVIAFAGLIVFVLPVMAIAGASTSWSDPRHWSRLRLSVMLQLLAVPAIVGISAVQEFVTRGRGTPVPFDPPKRLVTSGLYAYVGNPMQMAGVLLLLLLGFALRNVWVAAAGVMAHVYSAGIAGWDENADLRVRFGTGWIEYHRAVRRWWPRWRPWHDYQAPPATLYVSQFCGMCNEVGAWFIARGVTHLRIAPAHEHPSRTLTRISYESGDGVVVVTGIVAVARALEHVHFGWAMIAAALRLPIICQGVQLIVDASGGEPRRVQRRPSADAATRAVDQAH